MLVSWTPGALLLASLVYLANSRPVRDIVSKNKVEVKGTEERGWSEVYRIGCLIYEADKKKI